MLNSFSVVHIFKELKGMENGLSKSVVEALVVLLETIEARDAMQDIDLSR